MEKQEIARIKKRQQREHRRKPCKLGLAERYRFPFVAVHTFCVSMPDTAKPRVYYMATLEKNTTMRRLALCVMNQSLQIQMTNLG
jgi:hypothetical protein